MGLGGTGTLGEEEGMVVDLSDEVICCLSHFAVICLRGESVCRGGWWVVGWTGGAD